MNRRSLISLAPVASLAAMFAGPAIAQPAAPAKSEIGVLFDAWRAAEARFNVDGLDADDISAYEEMVSLRAQIIALQTRSHFDLAQQLYAFTSPDVLENYSAPCPFAARLPAGTSPARAGAGARCWRGTTTRSSSWQLSPARPARGGTATHRARP